VSAVDTDLARRLEQSISLAPENTSTDVESVICGPFRAWFTSYTDNPQLNYAMPITPTESAAFVAAIQALRVVFAERARKVRIEFVEELWPELATELQRSGMHLQAREPLMACAKAKFTPTAAPDVSVRALSVDDSDVDLATFVLIRDGRPLDGARVASDRAIASLRGVLRNRAEFCALGTVNGQPAAVGRCIPQDDGLGEITSIVTLPQFRRRGIAGTLVSFLLQRLFESDREIGWLNAANEQARSVYARLGFRSIGSLLNYED